MVIKPELVLQVRRKLNITWSDENTDARLNDIINDAIPTMIHKLGIANPEFDFSVPGDENRLFKSYCLYEWEHCANEFDDNYHNDIAQVQRKHTVAYYKESEGDAGEEARL